VVGLTIHKSTLSRKGVLAMKNLARFFLTAVVALMLLTASSHKFPVTLNTPITSPQRLLVDDAGVMPPLPPPPPRAC
jgi:hypothetical protein